MGIPFRRQDLAAFVWSSFVGAVWRRLVFAILVAFNFGKVAMVRNLTAWNPAPSHVSEAGKREGDWFAEIKLFFAPTRGLSIPRL